MLRSREITQQSIERSATLQTALAQWEQDWEQIQDSGQIVPPQAFDGGRLRLTRRHPQGLQVVSWFVDQGRLCRWAAPPVSSLAELRRAWERSEQTLTLASERVVVLEGIADWQLYYFSNNAWANAQSDLTPPTKETTPPAGGGGEPKPPVSQIPGGVRLQLQFAEGSGLQGQLTRQIVITGGGT
jgi:general secretion pathway protein J